VPDSALCTIRPATPADSEAILACLREAFEPYRTAYTSGAFTDTVLTPQTLAARFTTMSILVAVASDGSITENIAGTIAVAVDASEGHLRGMAVRTRWQGHGIAQQLLTSAESLLRFHRCRRVTLDTTVPLTRAIAFYHRNGYKPTGRVQDFYGMPLHEYAKELTAER
jgi:ribosomal protein S18 acetylase RimI-like enzyme